MRVITGTARGRRLKEPSDYRIRPTTDKVKEAIFNIVQFDIEGREILDLFAGTGQLGIEAISRGAKSVTFIDESRDAIKLIRDNLKATGTENGAAVLQTDALSFLQRGGKFDLIFMDPPYNSGILEKALQKAMTFDILKENGIIVCESELLEGLPELEMPYQKLREYRYGKIKITVYGKSSQD